MPLNNFLNEEERFEDSANEQLKGSAYVVYWSCLLILLQNCLTCAASAHIKKIITKDSAICVHFYAKMIISMSGDLSRWKTVTIRNLTLIAANLFSSNTYCKLSKYFNLTNIPWV